MINQNKILLCKLLTERYAEVIFWKHLDRGLNNLGDIDAVCPEEIALLLRKEFADVLKSCFPDVVAAVRCTHNVNLDAYFFASCAGYPRLEEIDFTYQPLRFGAPWGNVRDMGDLCELDKQGIRILKPGALSIVLLSLYGFNWKGIFQMKPYDYESVLKGLVTDMKTAHSAIDIFFRGCSNRSFHNKIDHLESHAVWDEALSKKVWIFFAYNAGNWLMSNGIFWNISKVVKRRTRRNCALKTAVHVNNRNAIEANISDWMNRMAKDREDIILFDWTVLSEST